MKQLCVVAVLAAVGFASQALAQDFVLNGFGFAVGSFTPQDVVVRDIYGVSSLSFSGGVQIPLSERFGFRLGMDFFQSLISADIIFTATAGDYFRVIPVTATFVYRFADRDADLIPYVGAGVGLYLWRDDAISLFCERELTNGSSLGGQLIIGLEKGQGVCLFVEACCSRAPIKSKPEAGACAAGLSSEAGGITLYAGVRLWLTGKVRPD